MPNRRKHIKKKLHSIKPKKSIFKRAVFWYAILLFIIILSIFYFVLFLPEIQVKNIEISGNEKVDTNYIETTAENSVNKKIISFYNFSVTSKSIFLAGLKDINKNILDKFPVIDSAEIKREYPGTLTIKVKERSPLAVFCEPTDASEKCFFIDKKGVIFEELKNLPQNTVILRQTLNSENVFSGKNVISTNTMDVFSKIEKNLKDNFQINISSALISAPLKLDITTTENWHIYFDLNSNVDLQITKMNLLLKSEIIPNIRKNLKYIDLRFDKAYYK